jgi:hypothetical protein
VVQEELPHFFSQLSAFKGLDKLLLADCPVDWIHAVSSRSLGIDFELVLTKKLFFGIFLPSKDSVKIRRIFNRGKFADN